MLPLSVSLSLSLSVLAWWFFWRPTSVNIHCASNGLVGRLICCQSHSFLFKSNASSLLRLSDADRKLWFEQFDASGNILGNWQRRCSWNLCSKGRQSRKQVCTCIPIPSLQSTYPCRYLQGCTGGSRHQPKSRLWRRSPDLLLWFGCEFLENSCEDFWTAMFMFNNVGFLFAAILLFSSTLDIPSHHHPIPWKLPSLVPASLALSLLRFLHNLGTRSQSMKSALMLVAHGVAHVGTLV